MKLTAINILRIAPRSPGIYSITNTNTGQVYIGSTNNLFKRLNGHRTSLLAGDACNKALQKDYDKFGKSAFSFAILEKCNNSDTKLTEREQYFVTQAYQTSGGCYNREIAVPRQNTNKRVCKICGEKHYAKGFCEYHYNHNKYLNR